MCLLQEPKAHGRAESPVTGLGVGPVHKKKLKDCAFAQQQLTGWTLGFQALQPVSVGAPRKGRGWADGQEPRGTRSTRSGGAEGAGAQAQGASEDCGPGKRRRSLRLAIPGPPPSLQIRV